jgi:hypothetical protein
MKLNLRNFRERVGLTIGFALLALGIVLAPVSELALADTMSGDGGGAPVDCVAACNNGGCSNNTPYKNIWGNYVCDSTSQPHSTLCDHTNSNCNKPKCECKPYNNNQNCKCVK